MAEARHWVVSPAITSLASVAESDLCSRLYGAEERDMPHFYFDLHQNGVIYPDLEGVGLPSVNAARAEGARTISDMLREPRHGLGRELKFVVRGSDGRWVFDVQGSLQFRPPHSN